MIVATISSVKIFVIGLVGSCALRLLNRTLRWENVGLDGEKFYWPHERARIVVFWHSQQLLMPWFYLHNRRKKTKCPRWVALISEHNDGRMIAKVMTFLGIDSVAGSSSRSGREALFKLIDRLKVGDHIAITPDGPKGPARQLKNGVIRIAERSGASIYPAAIAAKNVWTFSSWDKMILPKPFSRAVRIMGDEIVIPSKLNAEQLKDYSSRVEDALNDLSRRAESYQFPAS